MRLLSEEIEAGCVLKLKDIKLYKRVFFVQGKNVLTSSLHSTMKEADKDVTESAVWYTIKELKDWEIIAYPMPLEKVIKVKKGKEVN